MRAIWVGLVPTVLLTVTSCSRGDLGAPCNHGSIDPPSSEVVTFPALSCNDLLCVYGEDQVTPSRDCDSDDDCNGVGGQKLFECVIPDDETTGSCRLSMDYVLERSMCSKRCESDADCQNHPGGDRPLAADTACMTGFACTRLMKLGEFCCEKLCVCRDELPDTTDLEAACAAGNQPGCQM